MNFDSCTIYVKDMGNEIYDERPYIINLEKKTQNGTWTKHERRIIKENATIYDYTFEELPNGEYRAIYLFDEKGSIKGKNLKYFTSNTAFIACSYRKGQGNYSKVYPNPSNSELTLELEIIQGVSYKYSIINVLGIKQKEGILKSNKVDISDLLPGTYFLLTFDEKGDQKTFKFNKINN